jgi:hypothetical protein
MSPRKRAEPPPPTNPEPVVTHHIALEPADWFWATWRDLTPLERPEPAPFDLDHCVKRMSRVTGSSQSWNWSKAELSDSMSVEEARFWYAAMTGAHGKVKPKEYALYLGRRSYEDSPTLADVKKKVQGHSSFIPPAFLIPLATLFSLEDIVELLRASFVSEKAHRDWSLLNAQLNLSDTLFAGFRTHVRPYLGPAECARLRGLLDVEVDTNLWPFCLSIRNLMPVDVRLAAVLGMHEEMLRLVESWPDCAFQSGYNYTWKGTIPQEAVFALGSPDLVNTHMRRLGIPLVSGRDVRAWLAHTETGHLDHIQESILHCSTKPMIEELMASLALVQAPEVAPYLLELKMQGKAPTVARRWLEEQVGNAIAGLLPLAAGRGKLAEEAREYLREAHRLGHTAFLEEQLNQAEPQVAQKVRREVLEASDRTRGKFSAKDTPDWLRTLVRDALGERPSKLPDWVHPTSVPDILVGEHALNDEQFHAVITALRKSTLAEAQPLVKALRQKAEPTSLDDFAWKLFELWVAEGMPNKDKWVFAAVGLLGGDGCAIKLTPLIRGWPQQSKHQRAVTGLECLRAIGSDTALMQLHSIAQRQGKRLQERAQEFMLAIAVERGLSAGQLEDRIVPTLGLDERGGRVFDFGPRQFHFVLGPGLKPQVRDASGKLKANLPKPGAKDDPDLSEAAVREWKILKAQVREAVKTQGHRLEQAMIHGRRWRVPEFETYLVHHPFLTHLVRLLLWAGYDRNGTLLRTFRVTEEREYMDVEDNPCRLDDLPAVGIVHPVQMKEEERLTWGQVFGDYEILPPFPQLGRRFHTLEPGEEKRTELTRFGEPRVEPMVAMGILKRHGWTSSYYSEEYYLPDQHKPFPGANITAFINLGSNGGMDYQIKSIYFYRGLPGSGLETHKLPLGEVDPVVLSEVLGTAGVIASKGS